MMRVLRDHAVYSLHTPGSQRAAQRALHPPRGDGPYAIDTMGLPFTAYRPPRERV